MKYSWSQILWLVQSKLKQEDSAANMAEIFNSFGISWGAFPLPPFVGQVPNFHWDGLRIYYGSTKLVQMVSQDKSLRDDGSFFYDPVRYSTDWYAPRFGADWLNAGARRITAGDVLKMDPTAEFFIRPQVGVKLFSGQVTDVAGFKEVMGNAPQLGEELSLTNDTIVYVNDVLPIQTEYRTWYIGGKIAAVVGYKHNGKIKPWVVSQDATPSFGLKAIDEVWPEIAGFAKEQGDKIAELGAFVLDVACVPGTKYGEGRGTYDLKVVEINSIHSSDFYCPDIIHDVVCELTNYVREGKHGV